MNIPIKYRTWYANKFGPRHIKLKIPGWAGSGREYGNKALPQPWHCQPFVEASMYGLELIYPFESSCRVINDGDIKFISEGKDNPGNQMTWPPFITFAPNHYGFTSSLDISIPDDTTLRLESHPGFYTDITDTFPCVVPGHLQTQWWTRIFFVVFKAPSLGKYHLFEQGKPYAQIMVLPKKVTYQVEKMSVEEMREREYIEEMIDKADTEIAKHNWLDHKGHPFNDKYKVLSQVYAKSGKQGVIQFLEDKMKLLKVKNTTPKPVIQNIRGSLPKPKIPCRLFPTSKQSIKPTDFHLQLGES